MKCDYIYIKATGSKELDWNIMHVSLDDIYIFVYWLQICRIKVIYIICHIYIYIYIKQLVPMHVGIMYMRPNTQIARTPFFCNVHN